MTLWMNGSRMEMQPVGMLTAVESTRGVLGSTSRRRQIASSKYLSNVHTIEGAIDGYCRKVFALDG